MLGWLRENQVEVISLRESIDGDSTTGRAILHLAIVFAEMERRLARDKDAGGVEEGQGYRRRMDLPGGNWGTRSPRPEGKAGVIERGRIWIDGRLADYTREEPGFPVAR